MIPDVSVQRVPLGKRFVTVITGQALLALHKRTPLHRIQRLFLSVNSSELYMDPYWSKYWSKNSTMKYFYFTATY